MERAKVKESDVKLNIVKNLKLFCPQVVDVIRIFSGKVESKWGGWVQGADPGTADLLVLVNDNGQGHSVFVEVKRPRGGSQSDDQKIFQYRIIDIQNIHYVLARSLDDVLKYITENILKEKT